MLISNIFTWFREVAISILVASITVSLIPSEAKASEEIIFRYGGATQSVSLEDLQIFAETGETSASLNFLLKVGKQNPELIRWIMKQQFPADTKLIYDLLNTAPGEYILSQTGSFVSSKSERANVKALRGALVKSASDDNVISLIELLENYPTQQVYVNSKLLAKVEDNLSDFIKETNKYIKIPLSILSN